VELALVPAETRIVLVRHAQAVCNMRDMFAGHAGCSGLTAAGRDHCAAVARRLAELYPGPLVLMSSMMPRAAQTADAIAAELGIEGCVPRRCGLCERHPGSLEGVANGTVREMAESGTLPPDVETPEAFLLRARRELRRVAKVHPGRTVVTVTHEGVIAASFWAYGGVPARLPFRLRSGWGSVTEWSSAAGEAGQWFLRRYNDTPPMRGTSREPEEAGFGTGS
jgi:broad specificity phosphatase PhoE